MRNTTSHLRLGVVGLGVLGAAFAEHLVKATSSVAVHDIVEEKVATVSRMGARPAESPAAVVDSSEFVVLSLPNPSAVEEVFTGPHGVLSTDIAGKTFIDTSTVDPETNRRIALMVEQGGGNYLDAPVSGAEPFEGGMDGAIAGSLTFMVGGQREIFESAKPIFEVLGTYWYHLGPHGAGSTVKLISNLCSGLYVLVTAEAFALGRKAGVEPDQLLEVFKRTDAKCYAMTDYLLPRMLDDRLDPGFSIRLQLKDHRLAADLARTLTVRAPMNDLAIELYAQHAELGLADRDVTAVVSHEIEAASVTSMS